MAVTENESLLLWGHQAIPFLYMLFDYIICTLSNFLGISDELQLISLFYNSQNEDA